MCSHQLIDPSYPDDWDEQQRLHGGAVRWKILSY